jgi:hypothetical protein
MFLTTKVLRWITFLLFLFMVVACDGINGNAAIQVWLDSPLDGSVYDGSFPVTISAHARDVNGPGITEIQFLVNGTQVGNISTNSTEPLVFGEYDWFPDQGTFDIYARAISISGGIVDSIPARISVEDGQQPIITDVTQTPFSTPTFTITPRISSITSTPTQTITPPPPSVSFSAGTTFLFAGDCTDLSWQTTNTYAVSLDGTTVSNNNGTWTVCPEQGTTYTLEASYSGGTITRTVTVDVGYDFPLQRTYEGVTLSITGGHEGIHHLGDSIQFCYSFEADSGSFEIYDYSPATYGPDGAGGPHVVMAEGELYYSQNVCKNYTLVEPGGYEAFQFRVYKYGESPTPYLAGIAEVWFYTLP